MVIMSVSVGWGSRHGLAGSSVQGLPQAAIKVSASAEVSYEGSNGAGSTSKLTYGAVD